MSRHVLTVERLIPAPAAAIFDLLADAVRHPEIDGSGTVKRARQKSPGRLKLGSSFGMEMDMGFKYSMANTVIEFEEGRLISWQTKAPGPVGRLVGGRIWRYRLEPVAGGTLVQESWDRSQDHQRLFLALSGLPKQTRVNMERTLERIEHLVQKPAGANAPVSR